MFENLKLSDELECLWSTELIIWMIPFVNGLTKINKTTDQISLEFSAARTKLSLTEDTGPPGAAKALGDPDKSYP